MTSEYEYFKLYEMYPSKTKFIDICYIPTFLITMTELEGILRQLCPGLLSMVELPGGTPASAKPRAQATFASVYDADRALAIMNAHPALWGYGIKFCLPGSTFYQGHLTLFSRRVVEPLKLQVVPAREFWMDECEWPDDAPSPGQVYDVAVKYGKVHPVTLEKFDTKPSWGALVQYFYPADADKLDESDADVNFCGWKVDVYATDTDFAVEKQLAEMNKQRADLGLPPMGPDFVCELSEPSPKSSQSKTSDYEDIPATPLSGFESGVAVGLGDEKPFAEDFEQDSPATRNA